MNSLRQAAAIKSKNQKAICRRPLAETDDSCRPTPRPTSRLTVAGGVCGRSARLVPGFSARSKINAGSHSNNTQYLID